MRRPQKKTIAVVLTLASLTWYVFWPQPDPSCVQRLERLHAHRPIHLGLLRDSCSLPLGMLPTAYSTLTEREQVLSEHAPSVMRLYTFIQEFKRDLERRLAWRRVCPTRGVDQVIAETMEMTPMERARHVYRRCDVERLGLMDEETFITQRDGLQALPFYPWMLSVGLDPDKAAALTLGLMGSPTSSVPAGPEIIQLPRIGGARTLDYAGLPSNPLYTLDVTRGDVRLNGEPFARVVRGRLAPPPPLREAPRAEPLSTRLNNAIAQGIERVRHLACRRPGSSPALRVDQHIPYGVLRDALRDLNYSSFDLVGVRKNSNGTDDTLVTLTATSVDDLPSLLEQVRTHTSFWPEPTPTQITITHSGYNVTVDGTRLPPEHGCRAATLCAHRHDIAQLIAGSARALHEPTPSALDQANEEVAFLASSYPVERLRWTLDKVSKQHEGRILVTITAAPDIPYAVVFATVEATQAHRDEAIIALLPP